jgi:hypothetical protein
MQHRAKPRRGTPSIRQTVAIPAPLSQHNFDATYRRFMSAADPERKGQAGKDLIRAIFGKDAIAEDPVL